MNKDKPPVHPRFKKGQFVTFSYKGYEYTFGEIINCEMNAYYHLLYNNVLYKIPVDKCKLSYNKAQEEYDILLKEYNLYCAKLKLIKAQEEYDRILTS